jgi:ADP-ribosyl-[dinitrogen reductase] hydrolase
VRTGTDFSGPVHRWANAYPSAGFGGRFTAWMRSHEPQPYGSYSNGSVMRVSPVAYASDDLDVVLDLAARSASVTHDHHEAITGAQAVAGAILVGRSGGSTDDIRRTITGFGYRLPRSVEQWRAATTFDVTCVGTVPAAVQAVLEATDLESAIRNAVYIGGDADTLAAVAGSIAAALWGVPPDLADAAISRLDQPLIDELLAFDRWFEAARGPLA